MPGWLDPEPDLSPAARAYRDAWAAHWPDADPQAGGRFPTSTHATSAELHKAFRSPLSAAEEVDATAEFLLGAVRRLAAGAAIVANTFDWEWSIAGQIGHERFTAVPGLDRERWLGVRGDPAETAPEPPVLTHVFSTELDPFDPRLDALTTAAARGVPLTVTDVAATWVARLHEDGIDAHALDGAVLDRVPEAIREVRSRWGLEAPREALVDLEVVDRHIRDQRGRWSARGVQITTGPQYRTWPADVVVIRSEPPADWADVDWLLIGLTCGDASATVIAHDGGTCTVLLDRDGSGETSIRHRERAGTLDVGGVIATVEAVVAALSTRAPTKP